MSAHPSDERGTVTTYTYAPADVTGEALTWPVYDTLGRVVARGSGPTPDGALNAPDASDPRAGDPPDEPHVVG